ncbi:MAG: hypothetical protein D6831_03385, partial [Aquificota bacterium]
MEKDIFVNLDVLLCSEELYINQISEGAELNIKEHEIVITINNTPYYRGKLIKKDGISIIKILKIFSDRESSKISDK